VVYLWKITINYPLTFRILKP